MNARRFLPLLLVALAGCSVPTLPELEQARTQPLACDADHGCTTGYACIEGICQPQQGTRCVAGSEVTCGHALGECEQGVATCADGSYGACVGEIAPVAEVCNGKDDDCDGIADDEVVPSPTGCELGLGVCAGKGRACVGGTFEAICSGLSYGPTYEGLETKCDGLDNDCDGQVDLDADGKALRSAEACELSLGVCAGVHRSCVAGSFEATCGAASYGPDYQPLERTCGDAKDNDCDGRLDLSRESTIATSPGEDSVELSWVADASGYRAVYGGLRRGVKRVLYRRFDAELRPVGAEVELSVDFAQASSAPRIALDGDDAVVAWVDQIEGVTGKRLLLARIDADGALLFRDELGAPTRKLLIASPSGAPRIAVTPSSGYVAVVWSEGGVAKASTFDRLGAQLGSSTAISSGGAEVVGPVDVTSSGSSFVFGWGTNLAARFRTCAANLAGCSGTTGVKSISASGVVEQLALPPSGATAAAYQVHIAGPPAKDQLWQVTAPLDVAPSPVKLTEGSEPIDAVQLVEAATGSFVVWSQGTATPRVLSTRVPVPAGQTSPVLLAPSDVGRRAPAIALVDGAPAAVAYARSGSTQLDLAAVFSCVP